MSTFIIPSVTEVLRHRVTTALLSSSTFSVRVDLRHIPQWVRDKVREEVQRRGYVVWWNGEHPEAEKARRMSEGLGMAPEDYWLITADPKEPAE